MTTRFEDILLAICSDVKTAHTNDFQRVFVLLDMKEAKLAYDVLVSYGFDARIYHEQNKPSKLYITNPTIPIRQQEQKLSGALAYAQTLKQIKQNLDMLCNAAVPALQSPDYTISFINAVPSGKQILIQLTPGSPGQTTTAAAIAMTATAPAALASAPIPVEAAAAPQHRVAKKLRRPKTKSHYEELSAGPAVGKASYPGALAKDGSLEEQTLKKRILTYLRANIATSGFSMLVMVVILGVLFSFFVFAKAWMCPDFASMKRNDAWYCKSDDDDANKKKQHPQPQP